MNEHIKSADPRTRRPDDYTAPAQPAAEDEVADFIAALVRLIKPKHVLELGTAFGHTAAKIGKALQENEYGHLDTLEIKVQRLPRAKERLEGLPVTLHHANYQIWKPTAGVKYDLAFFDSDRENRDREYNTFRPYLNQDAVLLFHDAGQQHKKTQAALARLDLPFVYLPCPRGLVMASVPPD